MSAPVGFPGLSVGHATDIVARSGTTAVVFDTPAVCGVAVHGAAPGTRETDLLRPGNLNPGVDAIILSGGSAYGLAAGDGAHAALADAGRGFQVGPHRIPIVPAAIVFDLSEHRADYRALGVQAVRSALTGSDFSEGSVGAGTGASVAGLKGGIGIACETAGGASVLAIIIANSIGALTAANGPWFRARHFERGGEFGGLTPPPEADFASVRTKRDAPAGANTVIGLIATDAALTVADASRLATAAHDGIAIAAWPAHTILDGDTLFSASTGRLPGPANPEDIITLHAAAVRAVARAMARAVFHAEPLEGDTLPTWRATYQSYLRS
ncbi:MAG: P1 family peptidase [Pseudomonadota bacterium]